ncbi:ATP-dependent RNA helicase SrmB [Psychrosphaera sp. 1_MG-2023]|uniref:ATP-dependent RNA helicase SrmB n=1 Tax=Psychrosphaera sp. 1_MG-2023 TaxID=3062643 RepID=UPI0026E20310|nr:ATP-dependent RNA helicase SrmB [Psychrosphaera sp. 1_MG-2023]MDO6718302.1 ATP-dependent RNA helicase SrmB [Psychrosphaera sp. 1_MG-2023]
MTFDEFDLDRRLLLGIQSLGYAKPTRVQQAAIPEALDGHDVLASAPTGTGKTAAFLIPAIQYLLDSPRRNPGFARVMVLAPTRELAYQTYDFAKTLSQHTDLRVGVITGGINYGSHKDILEKNNDILISTPGRLLEYMDAETFHCEDVEVLILDEADRMLDMGFRSFMLRIADESRNRRQAMLFSATLEGRGIIEFGNHVLAEAVFVEADAPRSEVSKIVEWTHLADSDEHKFAMLGHYLALEDVKKSIVFVKTKERLELVVNQLQAMGIYAAYLQGEMPQDKRLKAIEKLKSGKSPVLVATDVAARGLDIIDVTHVFNFDLPRTADVYVHRIGRTARAGAKGYAVSFIAAHDMLIMKKIERYTEQTFKHRKIAGIEPKNKESAVPAKKKKPHKKKVAKALAKSAKKKTKKKK